MDYREGNTISFKLTEILEKKLRFIAIMQQISGVLLVIGGVLSCIAIFTAIYGIPMAISGYKMFQTGSSLNIASRTQSGDELVATFENMHGYWKFTLITFIMTVLFYLVILMFGISAGIMAAKGLH
ncbi:hypothetical protein J3U68_09455 [Snodgrassella sp. B3882]|uniref:DUF5362 family protein n=1 Tax=Snodgrassella sp. B3882 TaxID=2818037 RepID=UPI00226A0B24|nr:DUF5362 family protein [Snodgrassella sp. B3882]MCX8745634.1 hypothetical protein [Snodgrassella sp. B3882]